MQVASTSRLSDACDVAFFSVASFLDAANVWKLRLLSSRFLLCFTVDGLKQLRNSWQSDDPLALVELLRAADPNRSQSQLSSLLRQVGTMLVRNEDIACSSSQSGQTSITWASDYGLSEILSLLLGPLAFPSGANALSDVLHKKEVNGWYPLYRAAWNGRTECATMLMDARANPEGIRGGRYSPLIAAARWGHKDTVAAILLARADPEFKNSAGEDAIALARSQGHQSVLELLRKEVENRGSGRTAAEELDCEACIATRHTLGQGWWNLGSEFYSGDESTRAPAPFARVG